MPRGINWRKLLEYEAGAMILIFGMYAATLVTLWGMLHINNYYAGWIEVMFWGYSYLLSDSCTRLVQKLGYDFGGRRSWFSSFVFILFIAVNSASGGLEGVIRVGLQTSLFEPMVLGLAPGLSVLSVLYYKLIIRRDIVEHANATDFSEMTGF
jgi:hypothetical protein